MPFPHARHLLVKNSTLGADPLVDAVLAKNEDGSESIAARNYELAKVIFLSPVRRNYVDAALMTPSNIEEVATVLEIPLDIITTYRSFFFDVEGISKLGKLELLETYDEQGRDLLVWAMSCGLTFIQWRLGEAVSINPIEGLQEMFSMSVYKSKEAMFSVNGSVNSIEAVKWAKLSMDLARLLKMYLLDTGAAKKDIELALGQLAPNFGSFAGLDELPN
jgi:hypothetical protein